MNSGRSDKERLNDVNIYVSMVGRYLALLNLLTEHGSF
jgi:hypothetical protein